MVSDTGTLEIQFAAAKSCATAGQTGHITATVAGLICTYTTVTMNGT